MLSVGIKESRGILGSRDMIFFFTEQEIFLNDFEGKSDIFSITTGTWRENVNFNLLMANKE